MTRRVLVTGAAGFLAGHLVAALRADGSTHITGADAGPIAIGRVDRAVVADLLVPGAADDLIVTARPDEIYHLVGSVRGSDADIVRSNVDSARTVVNAARSAAPDATVVLVGSAAEYGAVTAADQPVTESYVGTPVFAYGRAKAAVSSLATAAANEGQRVLVARPFNVIGAGVPETLVVGALVRRLRAALAGVAPRRVKVGVTTSVRDWIDATDVARGFIAIARRGDPGAAYNLCTGRGHAVADLLSRLLALAGGDVDVEENAELSRTGEVSTMIGSPVRASGLGWSASRTLDESLRAAWDASAPTPASE